MPEEQNAFLIGGVLLQNLQEVNYFFFYLPSYRRKLTGNEELYVAVHLAPSEMRHIVPKHSHTPVLYCSRRDAHGDVLPKLYHRVACSVRGLIINF